MLIAWQSGVGLWNTDTSEFSSVFEANAGTISKAAASPDGKQVVITFAGGGAYVWDVETEQPLLTLSVQLNSLSWSSDGRWLAAVVTQADNNPAVQIWDVAAWEIIATIAEAPEVRVVTRSPDSTQLATGGEGGVIRIWTL